MEIDEVVGRSFLIYSRVFVSNSLLIDLLRETYNVSTIGVWIDHAGTVDREADVL